jgi:hypothetical protein
MCSFIDGHAEISTSHRASHKSPRRGPGARQEQTCGLRGGSPSAPIAMLPIRRDIQNTRRCYYVASSIHPVKARGMAYESGEATRCHDIIALLLMVVSMMMMTAGSVGPGRRT